MDQKTVLDLKLEKEQVMDEIRAIKKTYYHDIDFRLTELLRLDKEIKLKEGKNANKDNQDPSPNTLRPNS